ncbi:MAG TPA: hypothetical protein VG737_18130 [Cyclobacteriaceae bacterium]|nr:hypothetical protein [Cyclobacteriaceae bacterium]
MKAIPLCFLLTAVIVSALLGSCSSPATRAPIDRLAVVSRHNVVLHAADTMGSLSVGNGEFAFTVDASGLQTFPKEYENGIPLGTQSQWAWHSIPQKENYSLNDVAQEFESCDQTNAPYAIQQKDGRAGLATNTLRANPQRLHLGLIGLVLTKSNGEVVRLSDLKKINQELDLWSGRISTSYEIDGIPVKVILYADQGHDAVSAKISSPWIGQGQLRIKLDFPYGADCHVCPGYDFNVAAKHTTTIASKSETSAVFKRQLDSTTFFIGTNWTNGELVASKDPHHYEVVPYKAANEIEFSVAFSPDSSNATLNFISTQESSVQVWKDFWNSGGAVDFSECTDPRAKELERRVVLSQYLTRIQCAGTLPPQETGLTMNSWYGKFHLEMHWWHAAHFPLWGRAGLLERSMKYYTDILPQATATANWQHYTGARWPKMTDPYGNESPSSVGAFIIWQQPHPIYFAELLYRNNPMDTTTLRKYQDVVFRTAEFMASFTKKREGKYHLCHPLIPAQEIFKPAETDDPSYELQYWYYGLATAQQWRERLGMKRNERWDDILKNLAPLPDKDGLYLPNATTPDAYSDDQFRRDHPAVVGAFGFLPLNDRIDEKIMANTLENISNNWQWKTTWGWDYPLLAMTAARLNKPQLAIDLLLKEEQKNTYLVNGHNYQDKRLRLYLPGNGSTLAAVAMMAAGWDGSNVENPGFPKDGKWKVRWEGLKKMP